jgi:hypothetical protein
VTGKKDMNDDKKHLVRVVVEDEPKRFKFEFLRLPCVGEAIHTNDGLFVVTGVLHDVSSHARYSAHLAVRWPPGTEPRETSSFREALATLEIALNEDASASPNEEP